MCLGAADPIGTASILDSSQDGKNGLPMMVLNCSNGVESEDIRRPCPPRSSPSIHCLPQMHRQRVITHLQAVDTLLKCCQLLAKPHKLQIFGGGVLHGPEHHCIGKMASELVYSLQTYTRHMPHMAAVCVQRALDLSEIAEHCHCSEVNHINIRI